MRKDTYSRLRLFNGFITITSSTAPGELYRFHAQVGRLTFCVESKELYECTKENRRNT
jgi:hypothetical protein